MYSIISGNVTCTIRDLCTKTKCSLLKYFIKYQILINTTYIYNCSSKYYVVIYF